MSLTWRDVARKDFEDAVRSKLLWGLTVTFVGLMSVFMVIAYASESGDVEPIGAFTFLAGWSQFFVPLIAVIVGYMAIVGERRSGSLRVLLSFPFSRAAIVVGKVVGRTGVVATTIIVGFVVVSGLVIVLAGVPPAVDAVTMIALTIALGLTFTGASVGISAGTKTRGTAMALAVGMFLVLFILWDAIAVGIYYLAYGARPGLQVESWYLFVRSINPIEAYRAGLSAIAGEYVWPIINLGLEDIPMEATADERMLAERISGEIPFYLHSWFSGIIFLVWTAVPIGIGYVRFRRGDIE